MYGPGLCKAVQGTTLARASMSSAILHLPHPQRSSTPPRVLQGGGKRKGAFAIYLEPWHADIFDWLDLRKNHGKEEARARDLFYGLWVNDLFMQVRAA